MLWFFFLSTYLSDDLVLVLLNILSKRNTNNSRWRRLQRKENVVVFNLSEQFKYYFHQNVLNAFAWDLQKDFSRNYIVFAAFFVRL